MQKDKAVFPTSISSHSFVYLFPYWSFSFPSTFHSTLHRPVADARFRSFLSSSFLPTARINSCTLVPTFLQLQVLPLSFSILISRPLTQSMPDHLYNLGLFRLDRQRIPNTRRPERSCFRCHTFRSPRSLSRTWPRTPAPAQTRPATGSARFLGQATPTLPPQNRATSNAPPLPHPLRRLSATIVPNPSTISITAIPSTTTGPRLQTPRSLPLQTPPNLHPAARTRNQLAPLSVRYRAFSVLRVPRSAAAAPALAVLDLVLPMTCLALNQSRPAPETRPWSG